MVKVGETYSVRLHTSFLDIECGNYWIATEMTVLEIFGTLCSVCFKNVCGMEDYEATFSTFMVESFIQAYIDKYGEMI